MKKILFIIGSFREKSFNRQLARKAADYLSSRNEGGVPADECGNRLNTSNVSGSISKDHDEVQITFLDYSQVPFMNQDIEYPVPEPVAAARKAVLDSDGIWIFTPEYNHSYSGVVKNVIDWLSRPADPLDRKSPSVLKGKKVAISGAAGADAAADARIKMVQLAQAVGMEVIGGEGSGVVLGKEAFVSDELTITEEEEAALRKQAEEFINSI